MTSPWLEPDVPVTEVTVHRQPVVRPDRSVRGYAVRVVVRGPLAQAAPGELEALVHAELEKLDLAALAGGNVVFVRATTGMLTSATRSQKSVCGDCGPAKLASRPMNLRTIPAVK